jgi:hypothetical protein
MGSASGFLLLKRQHLVVLGAVPLRFRDWRGVHAASAMALRQRARPANRMVITETTGIPRLGMRYPAQWGWGFDDALRLSHKARPFFGSA